MAKYGARNIWGMEVSTKKTWKSKQLCRRQIEEKMKKMKMTKKLGRRGEGIVNWREKEERKIVASVYLFDIQSMYGARTPNGCTLTLHIIQMVIYSNRSAYGHTHTQYKNVWNERRGRKTSKTFLLSFEGRISIQVRWSINVSLCVVFCVCLYFISTMSFSSCWSRIIPKKPQFHSFEVR